MKVPEEKKVDVLLALLKERYEASHKMRERSYSFLVWILGFGFALIWLIVSREPLCFYQRLVLTILVVVMFLLAIIFLRSIDTGFMRNKDIMIRLEKTLGCYEKGLYTEQHSLYPDEYQNQKKTKVSFFVSLYILLCSFGIGIIALLWL